MFNINNLRKANEKINELNLLIEKSKEQYKITEKNNNQLIENYTNSQEKLEVKNEEISKLTDEYNALVKVNEEIVNNYNELTNNYNELVTNYNNLLENTKIISIQKTRTLEDIEEYPEESHIEINEQWDNESKLELLDTLTYFVESKIIEQDEEKAITEFSISIITNK
jgi:hypothetical protein